MRITTTNSTEAAQKGGARHDSRMHVTLHAQLLVVLHTQTTHTGTLLAFELLKQIDTTAGTNFVLLHSMCQKAGSSLGFAVAPAGCVIK